MDDPIINHEEARQLAGYKAPNSNLARCYLDLVGKLSSQLTCDRCGKLTPSDHMHSDICYGCAWLDFSAEALRAQTQWNDLNKSLESRLEQALERDRKGDEIIVELTLERDGLAGRLDTIREHCNRYGPNQSAEFYRTLLEQIRSVVESETDWRLRETRDNDYGDDDCRVCGRVEVTKNGHMAHCASLVETQKPETAKLVEP